MTKKSFILYHDTYTNIKGLPLEDKGKLLDAIFNYANNDPVNIDGIAGMAFSFIKSQMDRDKDKYDVFVEKQRVNGSKGGRPKKNTETQNNPNNPTLFENNPNNPTVISETQKRLNDTVNVTETDNVNAKYIYTSSFEEFWEKFPKQRRGSKKHTFTAFNEALERTTIEAINEGLDKYAKSNEVATGFAKAAVGWLEDDRWTNEYLPPKEVANDEFKPTYSATMYNAARDRLKGNGSYYSKMLTDQAYVKGFEAEQLLRAKIS